MTVVLFIAVLFVLILVHEAGHLLAAKWAKMRVDEFAIGFPPRLFAVRKGETDYSINLLPIGGFVKILGENGLDEIRGADRPRAFGARPRLQQAIVLFAGVAMNILTAWIIFFAVAMIGTPTAMEENEAGDDAVLTVIGVLPEGSADAAGIPLGSRISYVSSKNGAIEELTPSSFVEFVAANASNDIHITYAHDGEERSAVVTPKTGLIAEDPGRPAIGLSTALVETVRENPISALRSATAKTIDSLFAITIGLVSFIASAFTLSADLSTVTGPIGIAGLVGDAAEFGAVSLLIFTAFISLNLAVINLLPIPALDGGRLLFVAIEAVIRRPLNPAWTARVNFFGFIFLILLMVTVTYNDILKLF